MKRIQPMKKLLSALLALSILLSCLPLPAFATAEETIEPTPVCDCGTDDALIHAVSCAVYVAPENPQCFCEEKCTALNEWCDVCGFDYAKCGGTDAAAAYADSSSTFIVVGTAGLCGTEWNTSAAYNTMDPQDDGTYAITFSDVPASDKQALKVVEILADGTQQWYGTSTNRNIEFAITSACDVTVTFDPVTKEITVTGSGVASVELQVETIYAAGNGSGAWLNGVAYIPSDASNRMTETMPDVYEITYTGVAASENYQVKFVANGDWTTGWGGTYAGSGVETGAVFDGRNISFSVPENGSSVKLRLDLSSYDHAEETGATFTIIVCGSHSYVEGICTTCGTACAHTGGRLGTPVPTEDGKQHVATCDCCGVAVTEDHTGGTATCTTLAICDLCGNEYGQVDTNVHSLDADGFCTECDMRKVWLNAPWWDSPTIFYSETSQDVPMTKDRETGLWYGYIPERESGFVFRKFGSAYNYYYQTTQLTLPEDGNCYRIIGVESNSSDGTFTYYIYNGNWYFHPCTDHVWESGQCSLCGTMCAHTGGSQTCQGYACEICGAWYGEKRDHNFYYANGRCLDCGEFLAGVRDIRGNISTYYDYDDVVDGMEFTTGVGTLQLLRDIRFEPGACLTISYGTLDLNGFYLAASEGNAIGAVVTSGNLTICNSSETETGLIRANSSAVYAHGGYFNVKVEGNVILGGVDDVTESNLNSFWFENTGSSILDLRDWERVEGGIFRVVNSTTDLGSSILLPKGYVLMHYDTPVTPEYTVYGGAIITVAECKAHTGGTATCKEQAVCTICGASYGELGVHSTTAEGDKAATCNTLAYCSVCQKEFGEFAPNNHVSDVYTYIDNGDGTHTQTHECGVAVGEPEDHTIADHVCTTCGAMEIVVSFDAGDFEWKTGDELYFCRISRDNKWDETVFTATVAEDGTVTWAPDKTLYWDGTGAHKLVVQYPADTGWAWDRWHVGGDQTTPEKLRENDHMKAMWSGNPTTEPITFNLEHRMAKVTVNYEVAEGVTVSKAEVYTLTQFLFFDIDTLERKDVAWEEDDDLWINAYLEGNQFTAFVSPDAYAADGNFIKITLSDGTVYEVKMNKAVTFAEGGEYTYQVAITADGAYIACVDGCTFAYTDNGDGTHKKACSQCGYVAVSENHTLTYSARNNVITESCSKCKTALGTAAISATRATYDGTAKETATVTYSEGWKGGELTVSYENNINAGTATASITLGEATAIAHFIIAKADSVLTAPTARKLTYNGTNQALVNAGASSNGKLVYSLSKNGTYSEAIPTGKIAGSYTVWYYAVGNANHEDSEKAFVTVQISKATPAMGTVSYTGKTLYDTTAAADVTLSRSNASLDGTLKLTDDKLSVEETVYHWIFVPADTTNYNTITGTVSLTVQHIDADRDHECDGCGISMGIHGDEDKDHACDYGCQVFCGEHKDSENDGDHVCDHGCGETLTGCTDVDTDRDHHCDECGAPMPKDGEEVIFPEDTTGTLYPGAPAELDGKPIAIDWDGELWLEDTGSRLLVTYEFNEDSDPHKEYPTAMYAWYLNWTDEDGDGEEDHCEAIRIPELDNFMTYQGTSIRIGAKSDGIRFFTAVPTDSLNQAMKGTLLTGGLKGYQLVEMGTLYKWAQPGVELTTENGVKSYVYGGTAGSTFRVFSKEGDTSWFTGMLTDLPGDAETLAKDILSRPYAIFQNAEGEQITLYGGSIQRNIYYVAQQNRDTWKPGTAYDNYVEKIIATVEDAND